MKQYFVIGGNFQDNDGQEQFALACLSNTELPYVLVDDERSYFRLIWPYAHLYRVEDDYTLVLVAPSPEALQWGVGAPERVTPNANLLEKLQTVFLQDLLADLLEDSLDHHIGK